MIAAIIIQARMGSTRLPGKSLMEIEGKPILWHVIERAKGSREAGLVAVATTEEENDVPLAEYVRGLGIKCFRGNTDDVLDRYYQLAREIKAEVVVRITGDSPLVDPKLIDEAVRKVKMEGYDYASNGKPPWMDGFDVEAFSFAALERAWREASLASQREHVTPYIRESEKFRVFFLENDKRLDGVQLSIDRENDLSLVREIYKRIFAKGLGHKFTYLDVISLLEEEPELLKINSDSVVNEGYFKSLREDKKVK